MEDKGVLLDTSFFIRMLDANDPLHDNALGYFRVFLEQGFTAKVSTIAIAEYCTKGDIKDLPLREVLVLPFNYDHAIRAGAFMSAIYAEKQARGAKIAPRAIVPNDTKMFAQADVDPRISYYATSDTECRKVFNLLAARKSGLSFEIVDINIPYTQYFGLLPFETE